jgi:hypothetical protein
MKPERAKLAVSQIGDYKNTWDETRETGVGIRFVRPWCREKAKPKQNRTLSQSSTVPTAGRFRDRELAE